MKHVEKILELADMEFGSIAKNGKFRSREEIDSVYKLMDIVKDAMCVLEMENGGYDDDVSYRGGGGSSYRRMSDDVYRGSAYDGSYDGGNYRGRGRNARRDSMGRYSRDGGNSRYDGYSRDDGGRQEYIENLHSMMEDAPDEQTRLALQRMLEQMK